jgi:hypothetical protein
VRRQETREGRWEQWPGFERRAFSFSVDNLAGGAYAPGNVSITPDAAHIPWHRAGGLALSVPQHKTFDPGAFTADTDGVVPVRGGAHGTAGFQGRGGAPRRAAPVVAGARFPRTGTVGRCSGG